MSDSQNNNDNKLSFDSNLIIKNKTFLKEVEFKEYISYLALPRLSFLNCHFKNLDMVGRVFGTCFFKNCTFNQFATRKATFANCRLENCIIMSSDMTRTEFFDTEFDNCEFLDVNLQASDFIRCKFKTTKFFRSNLNFLIVREVKIWKSKEWSEVNDLSILEKNSDE